jgi:phosphate-selective porin OprO/OprP
VFKKVFAICSLLLLLTFSGKAQTEVDERAVINFDKGLGFFAPDSVFGFNLRFRMQNRLGFTSNLSTNTIADSFEAQVRRLRLRFDGFLGTQRFQYLLQLSFSLDDQDWYNTGVPGLIRDAILYYNFSNNFYVGFGISKLPGNRQRVVSSGNQQFPDRSIVNGIFNIDRDFGVMLYYNNIVGGLSYNLKGSITTGEGRNTVRTDNGLAYTGRLELLPLGDFKNSGDFSEGDLEREATPKVSIAAAYSYNHKAIKTSGQRGKLLAEATDIKTFFVDMVAKYDGWAIQAEYANRIADNSSFFVNPQPTEYVVTGSGINTQLSYCWPSMWELATRYSRFKPENSLNHLQKTIDVFSIGINKYLQKHKNKLQLNLSYQKESFGIETDGFLNLMFQIELGI